MNYLEGRIYYLVADKRNKVFKSYLFYSDFLKGVQDLIDSRNFDYFLIEDLDGDDYHAVLDSLCFNTNSPYEGYVLYEHCGEEEDRND